MLHNEKLIAENSELKKALIANCNDQELRILAQENEYLVGSLKNQLTQKDIEIQSLNQ